MIINLKKWINARIDRLGCWLVGHDEVVINRYSSVGRTVKNYRTHGEIIFHCEPYLSEEIPVKTICRRCGQGKVNHIFRTVRCSQDDFTPD